MSASIDATEASRRRAAATFPRRMVALVMITGVLASMTLAAAAPSILRLPGEATGPLLPLGAKLAAGGALALGAAAALETRRHRWLLRNLAIGSQAIHPDDLERLANLPRRLTFWVASIGALVSGVTFLAPLRPEHLDEGRALSLVLLSWMTIAAACVPFVVVARAAVSELFEIAPIDVVRVLVDRIPPERLRGQARLLASIILPVALAGFGGALATHAHLRSQVEEARAATARAIAHSVLQPLRGDLDATGRMESARVATSRGYATAILPGPLDLAETRDRTSDGRLAVSVPLEDARATFVLTTPLPRRAALVGLGVAFSGVVIAAGLAMLLARALARDLVDATARMTRLGTERVLPGAAVEARFEVVADLERATHGLAERFRVFAAAQERALEAREAARRTRGLLFASVSHDLKSPLNAILGFADLIDAMDLGPDQRESLDIVRSRGRELLGLIETILDAARVEAGQLAIVKQSMPVVELVGESVRAARLLSGEEGSISLEIDEGLPDIPVDTIHASRALGAFLAHAMKASGEAGEVVVRASWPGRGEVLRIDIVHGAPAPASARERLAMLAHRSGPRGRGMALALSLAKRVLELHGGTVQVVLDGTGELSRASADDVPVVKCSLPLARDAAPRPSTNTIPPLALSARTPPR